MMLACRLTDMAGSSAPRRFHVQVRASSSSSLFSDPFPCAPQQVEAKINQLTTGNIITEGNTDTEGYRLSNGGVVVVDKDTLGDEYLNYRSPCVVARTVATYLVTAKPEGLASLKSEVLKRVPAGRSPHAAAGPPAACHCLQVLPSRIDLKLPGKGHIILAALGIGAVAWHQVSRQKRIAIAQKQPTEELQGVLMDKVHADDMKLATSMPLLVIAARLACMGWI